MFIDFLTQGKFFCLSAEQHFIHLFFLFCFVLFCFVFLPCGTFCIEKAQWANCCPHALKAGVWKCNWEMWRNVWALLSRFVLFQSVPWSLLNAVSSQCFFFLISWVPNWNKNQAWNETLKHFQFGKEMYINAIFSDRRFLVFKHTNSLEDRPANWL